MKLSFALVLLALALLAAPLWALAAGDADVLLRKPFGMDVAPNGTLYVADIEANEIVVFDAELNRIRSIREIGGYGLLDKPFDVKLSGERFWIIDNGKSNVLLVDGDWKLIRKIGANMPGSATGEFSEPHALAVVPADGSIFVADTQNHRIQRFDKDGNFIASIDSREIGGAFPIDCPAGVTVLDDHTLLVTEYGDHPPVIADFQGNIIRTLESFGMAYGAACHGDRIAITWTYSDVVSVHHRDGRTLFTLGNTGPAQQRFNKPGGVAFAPADGKIIVSEWRNHRLQLFDADGKHLKTVGAYEPTIGAEFTRHERRFAERPIVLGAFTRVLSPEAIARYHAAGVGKIYLQPLDDIGSLALKQSIDAAHALGMKADFVFDTYLHGTRGGADGQQLCEFAREHPEYFTRKRDGKTRNMGMLSYAYPEVRQWKVDQIIGALNSSGADGVVLDYIRWPAGNTDGYDPPVLRRFEQMYGEDARRVDPQDPRWTALRSSYITQFLSELRTAIDTQMDRFVTVGVYVDANPEMEMRAVGRNWPVWSQLGLVDATHHMLYTDDFGDLYASVRRAFDNTGPATWVVSCIDVYAGYLDKPELLREGARVSALAGANEIVIVRDGKIESLDLFGAIRQVADDLARWDEK